MKKAMWYLVAVLFYSYTRLLAQEQTDNNAFVLLGPASACSPAALEKLVLAGGGRLSHNYPPHAFIGYIPAQSDAEIAKQCGAAVYRSKVDLPDTAGYGENFQYGLYSWNERFITSPGKIPQSAKFAIQQSKNSDIVVLSWPEGLKADSYRLQISSESSFGSMVINTVSARNSYPVYTAFIADGVYYWRVAGSYTLNTGAQFIGEYSNPGSFTITKPVKIQSAKPQPALQAVALPAKASFKGRPLTWPANPALTQYRVQLSEDKNFMTTFTDVFVNATAFKISGTNIVWGKTYYMRVQGSDGQNLNPWSVPGEITVLSPGPILKDMRGPARK